MTTGSILFDAWVTILLAGLLLYWVLIAPRQIRRHQVRRGGKRRSASTG
jgi:hypothetical protein